MTAPLKCRICQGTGSVFVSDCHHVGACPCDGEKAPCLDCNGTGGAACAFCGVSGADVHEDGDPMHEDCARIVRAMEAA